MSDETAPPKSADLLVSGGLTVIGALLTAGALEYRMGTTRMMGPGYFPLLIGIVLTALSALQFFTTLRRTDDGTDEKIQWRPVVCVLLGLVAFAVTIGPLGLLPASAAAVGVSAVGSREARLGSTLLLIAGTVVVVWLIFKLGLNVTIPSFMDFR